MAVLKAFVCRLLSVGRRPHCGSTEVDSGCRQRVHGLINTVRPGPARTKPEGRLPLNGSEQVGSNPGRIRAVSSDCLRSPLQPDLAGHSRSSPRRRRSGRCSRNTRRTARLVCRFSEQPQQFLPCQSNRTADHGPMSPGRVVAPSGGLVRRPWTSQNIAWMILTMRARCGWERSARWATASSTRASGPASGR